MSTTLASKSNEQLKGKMGSVLNFTEKWSHSVWSIAAHCFLRGVQTLMALQEHT